MADLRIVVDLPRTGHGLAALVREMTTELCVESTEDTVVVEGEEMRLVLRRKGDAWRFRARPDLAFPYASQGVVTHDREVAVLLGPLLGLSPDTLTTADDPAQYLRLRAAIERSADSERERERENERRMAAEDRQRQLAVVREEGDDDE